MSLKRKRGVDIVQNAQDSQVARPPAGTRSYVTGKAVQAALAGGSPSGQWDRCRSQKVLTEASFDLVRSADLHQALEAAAGPHAPVGRHTPALPRPVTGMRGDL